MSGVELGERPGVRGSFSQHPGFVHLNERPQNQGQPRKMFLEINK